MKITTCNICARNYKGRDRNFKGAFYNNLSCQQAQIFFITVTGFLIKMRFSAYISIIASAFFPP
jgi:hypothetical protein